MNSRQLFATVAVLSAISAVPVDAQTVFQPSLAVTGPIPRDGTWLAGDMIGFALDHVAGAVRLRFQGSDEVFYLISEPAPLGGHTLKYDTGDTALQVAGWGGVTLYTDSARTGLPAEYSDVVHNVDPPPVPPQDVRTFALNLARELTNRADFAVGFAADWDALTKSASLRELACEAMRNAAYGLEIAASGVERNRVTDDVHIVHIVEGARPSATYRRGVLTITVAPKLGPSGRPSSLAVARDLSASF